MPTLDFKPEKPPALSINTAAYSIYAARNETEPLLAHRDGVSVDRYDASPYRSQVSHEDKTGFAIRTASIAGGIISAPFKVVLTPIACTMIGAVAMGAWWGGNGALVGAMFLALLGDANSSSKSKAQQVFESTVGVVLAIPFVVATGVTGGVIGFGLGAARGGLDGLIYGIGEGYQASWDNRMPGLSPGNYLS